MKILSYFKKSKTEKEKGILALVLLSAIFASMGIYIRYLSVGFTPLQQVYLRIFIAFIFTSILFHKKIDYSKLKKLHFREYLLLLFRGASMYLFGVALITEAIVLTKLSTVAFINALPISQLLGFIFFREKVKFYKVFLIATAFLGVILIGVTDYSHLFSWGLGEIFALIATFFFAFTYVTRKWQSGLLNNYEITQLTLLAAFLSVFLVSLIHGEGLPLHGWTLTICIVLLLAGLSNVCNVFLINYGFEKVNVVLASNILNLESAFAILFGYLFYREIPTLLGFISGLVIVVSVIAMNTLEKHEGKKSPFEKFVSKEKTSINEGEITS
jgi:drug/metabolite transporter (DMT)-like permease